MVKEPVVGVDPHQDQFTVGMVDNNGVEVTAETLPTARLVSMTQSTC